MLNEIAASFDAADIKTWVPNSLSLVQVVTAPLLAFASECIRQHDKGRGWLMSAPRAAFHCLSLAAPLLLMVAWREHGGGKTLDWFNWKVKWQWIVMALRDRWRPYDQASVGVTAAPREGNPRGLY